MSEEDAGPPIFDRSDRTHMARQPTRRAPGQLSIPFSKREGAKCPWPEWDASQKTGAVCGLPSDPKTKHLWCRHHYRLAYHKP